MYVILNIWTMEAMILFLQTNLDKSDQTSSFYLSRLILDYIFLKNIFIPRNELCVRGTPTFRQGVLYAKLGKIYYVLGIQHVKEKLSFIFP